MQKNTIYVSQKIIYKKPVNEKIIIQVDKPALRRFSYIFLAALLIIAFRATYYEAFDASNFTLLAVVLVPYLVYAIYYYYTRTNSTWYIDLKNKKIILGNIGVPYFMIERLSIIKSTENSQLILLTKDSKRLPLFTDENEGKIIEVGEFFASVTKILFDKNVKK